jgi:hypothetical protein
VIAAHQQATNEWWTYRHQEFDCYISQIVIDEIQAGAIPKRAVRDAAHIAVAVVNDIDYLLTWNCRHLANAQIIRRVSVICNARRYSMPVICTPEELMGV